jgi:hypothetical protein
VADEISLWAGFDLVGDGMFRVSDYESSNVYRFDLAARRAGRIQHRYAAAYGRGRTGEEMRVRK